MKFPIKKINAAAALLLVAALLQTVAAQVPARPDPPRLVNDLAGILSPSQVKWLEDSLVRFDRHTSNQVVVVTIDDLGGMDPAEMAYEIGEQWQVGTADDNNGVVVLVKPKKGSSRGQAFIATGYGLEGALPDATCKMIVEREMIPHFKQNDYFGGIRAAVEACGGDGEFVGALPTALMKPLSGSGARGMMVIRHILHHRGTDAQAWRRQQPQRQFRHIRTRRHIPWRTALWRHRRRAQPRR